MGRVELNCEKSSRVLLLKGVGVVRAEILYTVEVDGGEAWNEFWELYQIDEEYREASVSSPCFVVKSEHWADPPDYDAVYRVMWWFVPEQLTTPPDEQCDDLSLWFFEGISSFEEIYDSRVHRHEELEIVDKERVPSALVSNASEIARALSMQSSRLSIDTTLLAAAKLYSETEPSGLNDTIMCYWKWRIAFSSRVGEASGIVTIEFEWSEVDASEHDEVNGPGGDNQVTARLLLSPPEEEAIAAVVEGRGIPLLIRPS